MSYAHGMWSIWILWTIWGDTSKEYAPHSLHVSNTCAKTGQPKADPHVAMRQNEYFSMDAQGKYVGNPIEHKESHLSLYGSCEPEVAAAVV